MWCYIFMRVNALRVNDITLPFPNALGNAAHDCRIHVHATCDCGKQEVNNIASKNKTQALPQILSSTHSVSSVTAIYCA